MIKLGDWSMFLTQSNRIDRMQQAEKEFERVGLEVRPFWARAGKDALDSFNKSQSAMVKCCLLDDGDVFSLFEDDVIFKNYNHLLPALESLPFNWDICYLGANITNATKLEKVGQYLVRVNHAWTTHAVIYSRGCLANIATNYDPAKGGIYDDWLARNIAPFGNTYVVNPMICWQRPGKSDLWGRDTDYTSCFEQGDKMMNEL